MFLALKNATISSFNFHEFIITHNAMSILAAGAPQTSFMAGQTLVGN